MTSVSLAIICIISVFLVFREGYEDGLIGRAGLLVMAFGAFVYLFEMAMGVRYEFKPGTLLLMHGIAIFLARHCYRFLRSSCDGRFSWKKKGAPHGN